MPAQVTYGAGQSYEMHMPASSSGSGPASGSANVGPGGFGGAPKSKDRSDVQLIAAAPTSSRKKTMP
ncbi:MAG: hypothetical protein BGO98_26905 [Myxococcales bacterium 68-20]|nr:MAG: hypothetical protein BGO98_26905 [Myxococcales bacterium 68-20]